jgi:hypothetical protein
MTTLELERSMIQSQIQQEALHDPSLPLLCEPHDLVSSRLCESLHSDLIETYSTRR